MTTPLTAPVLLFDGVCNVCNAAVQFVLAHEQGADFEFASLQSPFGRKIVAERGLPADIDTVVVLTPDRSFVRSSAAVFVLRRMRAPWRWLWAPLWLVPLPLRDVGYRLFARMRYRLFGKRDACIIPLPEQKARFRDA